MARVRPSAWGVRGFLIGVAFGLLYVVPSVLMQSGVPAERFRDSWITLPGFIAAGFTIAGVFMAEAKYVYVAMILGVVANGLFWGLVGHAVRPRVSDQAK